MTLQEKIQKKSEGFGKLAPVFLEGAEFALNNQWISVEEDLPCNHKELIIKKGTVTKRVLVLENGGYWLDRMMLTDDGKWDWLIADCPTHWFPIPQLPKE